MATVALELPRKRTSAIPRSIRRDPPLVRWGLTLLALLALGVFIVLPLVAVFVQAFAKGLPVYLAAIREPDTLSAIRLSLLAAGVSVPLNLVFGVAAAWTIAKFQFKGKSLLVTLIDIPFAVSPVDQGDQKAFAFELELGDGPVQRQKPSGHLDRHSVRRFAGRLRLDLRAHFRRPGMVRLVVDRSRYPHQIGHPS